MFSAAPSFVFDIIVLADTVVKLFLIFFMDKKQKRIKARINAFLKAHGCRSSWRTEEISFIAKRRRTLRSSSAPQDSRSLWTLLQISRRIDSVRSGFGPLFMGSKNAIPTPVCKLIIIHPIVSGEACRLSVFF